MEDKTQMTGLLADKPLVEELRSKASLPDGLYKARGLAIPPEMMGVVLEEGTLRVGGRRRDELGVEAPNVAEAIILDFGRPALLVQNDTFEVPESDVWKARLYLTKSKLEYATRSVGRVELLDHDSLDWVGTAWMVSEDVAITNRHVALFFARRQGRRFPFEFNLEGITIRARIDFKVEYKENAVQEIDVEKVVFIADEGNDVPDIALLKLRKGANLPPPISLSSRTPTVGGYVVTIGYPARDSRSDSAQMLRVFGDIYNVKRLAPGTITSYDDGFYFTHDCSTLGGNSGSVVVDVESGEALGLHFGGTARKANYSVKADILIDTLRKQKVKIAVPALPEGVGPEAAEIEEAPAATPAQYADRRGYDPAFLTPAGASAAKKYRVPLPILPAELLTEAVRVHSGEGNGSGGAHHAGDSPAVGGAGLAEYELKYSHFSLVMNGERKMAFFTVVNIDGRSLKWIPRAGDLWLIDPRIPRSAQAGNDLYRNNDLDKGHLVRRLDPVWGVDDLAHKSNQDTFHYTNASPQHKDLNQKTWNDLEDYILDNAGAHELKVTVFTGPVFSDDDITYRSFRIPKQFWKVVVMVKAEDMQLSATAYILSQQDLISNLEFAFGQFRTYQVPVSHIESLTRLNFGNLRDLDPIGKEEAAPIRLINRFEDVVL